ncbi:MAG: class I SAM-dependent methyltransferase, partial [SAR202 cluster bacterium]|nr:class I SAM-dependent methyltransferase [SAR202 cluster bacterium]
MVRRQAGQGVSILSVTNPYESWAQREHTSHFGGWDRYSTRKLLRACNQFNECQMAMELAKVAKINSVMDVGCATGRFYRFFREVFPGVDYRGLDISQVAIDHAKKLYPQTDFAVFDGDPTTAEAPQPDLLFCRDVVHHQPDPKEFLAKLYATPSKYLLLRVRTREVGETVFDREQSCQLSYNIWVPYIVFNTQELIDLLSSYSPRPAKIDIARHPDVLGGQLNRYLPKELYFPETGTAETS